MLCPPLSSITKLSTHVEGGKKKAHNWGESFHQGEKSSRDETSRCCTFEATCIRNINFNVCCHVVPGASIKQYSRRCCDDELTWSKYDRKAFNLMLFGKSQMGKSRQPTARIYSCVVKSRPSCSIGREAEKLQIVSIGRQKSHIPQIVKTPAALP